MTRYRAEDVRAAAAVLGLGDRASYMEIRERYSLLLKRWHPDRGSGDPATCHEMTIRIVAAYRILHDYCTNYEFSFAEEDIRRQKSAREIWEERFGDDPIWH
ncbi:MAG: J domain-containing protein [Methanomicrobiaceae archaeon]|nr:J domain-containing protein [Methanomicrobiaceae archaeon]